ncbi:MAG: phosphopantetheine-binding protein [Pseudomonadota bacterium]
MMTLLDRESIFKTVAGMIQQMQGDWEYAGEITDDTFLVSDLGFESLDIVVLGETIQQHYEAVMPFSQFLADVGQREVRDISVGECVAFTHKHLGGT